MTTSDQTLGLAILTISDTRTFEDDTSGDYLVQAINLAGHRLVARSLVRDDIYAIRAEVSRWIADPTIHAVVTTGGTGFSGRDSTPEALAPLFDKVIEGFGESFRALVLPRFSRVLWLA
jgi:molybdenum cofactor biosynthesis protein B